jgi:hypothetical protein
MNVITLPQLQLGLDCVMKMKHARDGLAGTDNNAEAERLDNEALVERLYWSCHPPDFECPDGGLGECTEWTRAVLTDALSTTSSTGVPRRIRDPVIQWRGMALSAREVVVGPETVEVSDLTTRLAVESAADLLTREGTVRANWTQAIIQIALKRMILGHLLAELAPGRTVTPYLVFLRPEAVAGAGGDNPRRTLDEFRLENPFTRAGLGLFVDTRNLVTRSAQPTEGSRTFRRIDVTDVVRALDLHGHFRGLTIEEGVERLLQIVQAGHWPDTRSCLSTKCKSCEFRQSRSPDPADSGFTRCWGPGVRDNPHHILKLAYLNDEQLSLAMALAGPEATIRVLPAEAIRASQRAQYVEARTQSPTVDRESTKPLARDGMPACFLAITAASCPISICRGMGPYDLFPFHFSAYMLGQSEASLTHRRLLPGFVHAGTGDSRPEFVRELRNQLGDVGPVYVWSTFERMAVRHIVTAMTANGSIVAGDEDHQFLVGLIGDADRPGRIVELHPIARSMGIEGSSEEISLTKARWIAWRQPAVRIAFGPGHAAAQDPRTYLEAIEAFDGPVLTAEALGYEADDPDDDSAYSLVQSMGPTRLFLWSRLLGKSDSPAIRAEFAARGDLRAASVLMAHHLLCGIAQRPTDRNVRIFVSSTFRDFRAERDILKRMVEPELQRRAADRSVSICVVDLRWGITDEQAKAGMILPICLQEIARCRPYFVGLLGERYGWVPAGSAIPPTLSERMPWLREHAGGASVTELEIRHGALQAGAAGAGASFYLRSPSYARGRGDDFESAGELERTKLADLKRAIRNGGFFVREDYRDPEEFGRLVTEDLWGRVDAMFPAEVVGAARHSDVAVHDAWAWSLDERCRPYHESAQRAVDASIRSRAARILIVGESGSGKSSLLAKSLRGLHGSMDHLVVRHFVGVGATPATSEAIAARVVGALARAIGVPPPDDVMARSTLRRLADRIQLEQWHPVIAIDGLDAVPDASRIAWIWEEPLENATILLAGLPGKQVEARFGSDASTRTVRMGPISATDRADLVNHLLAQHGRTLRPDDVAAIAGHAAAGHPGFIAAVVNELLVCDSFEKLPARLRECIGAQDLAGLYHVILRRLDSEMAAGFVASAMRTLLEASDGIREPELVARVGGHQAEWSTLRLQLGEPIIDSGGLIAIRPGPFADAVRARYGGGAAD